MSIESSVGLDEMLAAMQNEEKAGKKVSLYWKPVNELTSIRFLPPLSSFDEGKLFYQKRLVHYVNGVPYYCLNQSLRDKNGNLHEVEECPICKKSKQLYANSQKGSEDWGNATALRAKERYVSRVVVRDKKDAKGNLDEAKPEFWEFGQKIHSFLFSAIKNGKCGAFWSIKDGRDFDLSKKGTGRETDYSGSMLSMEKTPVFTDQEKLQTLANNLKTMDYSQLVEFKSKDELKDIVNSFLNGEEETEEKSSANNEELINDAFSLAEELGTKSVKTETSSETNSNKDSVDIPEDIANLFNSI